jgi:tetratricopeptide (TPR) repeat protein
MAKLDDRTTPPAELGAAYGELGLILMAAEYYEAAASCYLTAQALVPDDAQWPYYLGHLYRIQGDTAKAARFFSQASDLRPGDAPTLVWLGEMYLDQNRPGQAEPLFLRALSQDPSSAAASRASGVRPREQRILARDRLSGAGVGVEPGHSACTTPWRRPIATWASWIGLERTWSGGEPGGRLLTIRSWRPTRPCCRAR